MVQKLTPSQLKSKIRQIESKQRQAINKLNQAIRTQNQKTRTAINNYNNEVRKHNARVRADRQNVINQLNRLISNQRKIQYQEIRNSAIILNSTYEILESRESEFSRFYNGPEFLDLSERENANSLETSNILESQHLTSTHDQSDLLATTITNELLDISPELERRWKGALFSLNPNNPDAARHFCTSAREVFIQILEIRAPGAEVLESDPECEKVDSKTPTRKAKIKYLLTKSGILEQSAVDFVDEDVKNVLQLFRTFNDGTHGSSGHFDLSKLRAIKQRVESGVKYLYTICTYT